MLKATKHTNPDGQVVTIYLGSDASIGDCARIGNGASIGSDARIGSYASIGSRARIGDCASIGDRASIGSDAKRYAVRSDDYVFTPATRDGVPMVFAGCREFTHEQAQAHWGPGHPKSVETLAILSFLFC